MERLKYRLKLMRPLIAPFLFYFITLAVAFWGQNLLEDSPWRYALMLLPLIPGVFIAAGIIKVLGKLDELEKKIIQDSLGIAFMLTFLLSLGVGLLEVAGMTPVNNIYLGAFMAFSWLAGKLVLNRKYK